MTRTGSTLDDIRPDIVEVLYSHGVDEIKGKKVKCPYHGERNASAVVNTDTQRFHCFVCDVSGDAFDLIQAYENCDLPTAMQIAADNYNAAGAPARSSSGRGSTRKAPRQRTYVSTYSL